MARYNKGASAERELMELFAERGFAVVRSAGSGKNHLPSPDLIVLGNGRNISIECKAWRAPYLAISSIQMNDLIKWERIAGSETYIAWKYPNKGWFFLKASDFAKGKYYTISFEKARKFGVSIDVLCGLQSTLR
jgi:Holliday junction resolvase